MAKTAKTARPDKHTAEVSAPQTSQSREAARDAQALHEMEADIAGTAPLETVASREVPMVDVVRLRKSLGMSQERFCSHFGFRLGSVRNWEQGRRLPERPARILLRMIEDDPERVERFLREAY
ncbi:helix-turn-helix domain-containing protein [Phaeobacter italicus]|jgi:putative transcriptional regulator|uniref:helix-turn-helix domain-containing protein n=1 Tax=Phaeobacter italicus TaxID=481446 RepID=UPI001CD637AD|nr:transcriptional regulator [Phaeobacter italicus]MCA0856658.1 transcriptional regulator [Phaeobacter italicus]